MILSVCINPALDLSATVDQVEPEAKLRANDPVYEAGGGGVNVAKAAEILGASTHLLVALGGHTGARVADLIGETPGSFEAVEIAAETRQSVSISAAGTGRQYRFVFPGARLTHDEVDRFTTAVVAAADDASVVVLSGSLPPGVDDGLYRSIADQIDATPVIVDTSGPAFIQSVRSTATLLKPSVKELGRAVGHIVSNETEYVEAAEALLASGQAEYIAVSLGPGGAILVGRDGPVARIRPPAVRQVSAVGAGDSMVAAIAVELDRGGDIVNAVRAGVSAGTAAVLTPGSELCRQADVAALDAQVLVERMGAS